MCLNQNFCLEIIKNTFKDPRPNHTCNRQFGNPSNHATFFTSLIVWTIMEKICLEKAFRFKNNLVKIMLYISFPLVLYSRIYLNYHFVYQVYRYNIDY